MLQTLILATALLSEGTIHGVVRAAETHEPIAHAVVRLSALDRAVRADAHGYFVIKAVPAGKWRVEATALGYAPNSVTVMADGAATLHLDFDLSMRPVRLPGVEVLSTAPDGVEPGGVPPPVVGSPVARVSGESIKFVPGLAEPDLLKALQMLPAVTAISDFSSALYVRGGASDQTLISIDGIPLFNPYHLGGVFSAINADAVSTVDVWTGGIPAGQGDRLSGAVDIRTREGGRDRVRSKGGIGLASAYATVDGPLPGRNGSFLVSGRRSYIDAAIGAARRIGITPNSMPYAFSDIYGKATHSVGGLGALTLAGYLNREAYRAPDQMAVIFNAEGSLDWGSRMIALTYRQPLGGTLLFEARAGYSGSDGVFDALWREEAGRGNGWVALGKTRVDDVLVGGDLTWYGRAHTLRAGVQLDAYRLEHGLEAVDEDFQDLLPPFSRIDRPRTVAVYIEDDRALSDRFRARYGVRLLEAGPLGRAWLPRLGISAGLTPGLSISLNAGRTAQALRGMRNDESAYSSFVAYDAIAAQPEEVGLATGSELVLGTAWAGPATEVRLEAYTRWMDGLTLAPNVNQPKNTPILVTNSYRRGTGRTHGIEAVVRQSWGRTEVGLGYAFAISRREADGHRYDPRFERRHTADLAITAGWGTHGVLSARVQAGTGQPYTPVVGTVPAFQFNPGSNHWAGGTGVLLLGEHNSERLPAYIRMDLAVRRGFEVRWFGRETTISPYIQVLNIMNRRNTMFVQAEDTLSPVLTSSYQLPIVPTLGVEWRF